MKRLSILGCGWLGFALAKKMQSNYNLNVSTTTKKKYDLFQSLGWNAFVISEKNHHKLDAFLECDYLIIALPPSKFDDYLFFLKTVIDHPKIKNIRKIIFISSTSVYDKESKEFFEESLIQTPSNKMVFNAETLIKESCHVIFRCAGLMGYDRIAGNYFAHKKVRDKNSSVNYVHQDDVINAIKFAIDKNIEGVFNLCSNVHPTKEAIYTYNAQKHNFKVPCFDNIKPLKRTINGKKIEGLGFKYVFDHPFDYL